MKKTWLAWVLAIGCVVAAVPLAELPTAAATGDFLGGQVAVSCYGSNCDYPAATPTQLTSLDEVVQDANAHQTAHTDHRTHVTINSGSHTLTQNFDSSLTSLAMYGESSLTNTADINALSTYDGVNIHNTGYIHTLELNRMSASTPVTLTGSYASTFVTIREGFLDLTQMSGKLMSLTLSGQGTLLVGGSGVPSSLSEAEARIRQHTDYLTYQSIDDTFTLMDTAGNTMGMIHAIDGQIAWTATPHLQTFVVTDMAGTPVPDAYVSIYNSQGVSISHLQANAKGEAFASLPAGRYHLLARSFHTNLTTLLENKTITNGEVVPIAMEPMRLVTVHAHKNGQTVPIDTYFTLKSTAIPYNCFWQDDGTTIAESLPTGTHTLYTFQRSSIMGGSGLLLDRRTVTVTSDMVIDIDLDNLPPPTTSPLPSNVTGSSDRGSDSGSGATASTEKQPKTKVDLLVDGYTFTVKADGPTARGLQSVLIDGQAVTAYTVKSGSVIVALKNSLVQTLKPGSHTIRLEFLNHVAEAQFIVDGAGAVSGAAGAAHIGSDDAADIVGNANANPGTGR